MRTFDFAPWPPPSKPPPELIVELVTEANVEEIRQLILEALAAPDPRIVVEESGQ